MELTDVQTPALLVDIDRFRTNCEWMKRKAKKLGVTLRPHLKTHKCWELAKEQMLTPQGPATVSTLLEAEKFFNYGVKDLIYAVGISPSKFERAVALRQKGCDLKVILDNMQTARKFNEYVSAMKIRFPVLIEIDCDGHRSGVKPLSGELLEVAAELKEYAYLAGLLTHAGDSYKCVGEEQCAAAQENERNSLVMAANRLREAGYKLEIISAGSTPTTVFARNWEGVTEIRCGVYCFFDLVMAGIGACDYDQIALSLLVEVIGHQKERGWIIVDGGWMALSRDRGTSSQRIDQGSGLVCDIHGKVLGDYIVLQANQEHGIITRRDGKPAKVEDFPVGTRLRILPVHACAMSAQHPRYFILRNEKIVDQWKRFYGWQPQE